MFILSGVTVTSCFRGRISYLKVFDKPPYFNLGIFALKQGCHMPIHNHNEMYGIIKPLLGSGFVYSYTPWNKNRLNMYNYGDIVEVSSHDPLFISSSQQNSVAYLEPCWGNIHTIEARNVKNLISNVKFQIFCQLFNYSQVISLKNG